jgi:hypothetical protein
MSTYSGWELQDRGLFYDFIRAAPIAKMLPNRTCCVRSIFRQKRYHSSIQDSISLSLTKLVFLMMFSQKFLAFFEGNYLRASLYLGYFEFYPLTMTVVCVR